MLSLCFYPPLSVPVRAIRVKPPQILFHFLASPDYLYMKLIVTAFALLLTCAIPSSAQSAWERAKQAAKDKVNQRVDNKTNQTIDTTLDAAGGKNTPKPASAPASTTPAPASINTEAAANTPASTGPVSIAAYQNYDFTPGDTILFADDFTTTQDGEFPEQWELLHGQGVVNKQQGYQALLLTDGYYARVAPRLKTKTYLPAQFTLEYDVLMLEASYPLLVMLQGANGESKININHNSVDFDPREGPSLSGTNPAAIHGEAAFGKWHHVALAVKKQQLKVYIDQYRVLTVPDMHTTPTSCEMAGIGSPEGPLVFRNVRLAVGGGMNLIGQKFTDSKIVTHGINFDIDKAALRPESMGTLNQINRVLTENPDLKFEVGGHTDNTGTSPHNLTLSQQRAEAVKTQLIAMGISPTRLTAKGYGDTKPSTTNDIPEGKANNHRVEFTKIP